jgi:phage baseplate assembly protein W
MPIEKILSGFKDISMSFQSNPISNDLVALKDANAIARSVRNLVLTSQGERFFNPTLGSRVSKLLFENMDDLTLPVLKEEIKVVIENNEPRVEIVSINVTSSEENSVNVDLIYKIVGIDLQPQQLSFVLQPTR